MRGVHTLELSVERTSWKSSSVVVIVVIVFVVVIVVVVVVVDTLFTQKVTGLTWDKTLLLCVASL
jgi:hypothetical protein